MKSLRNLFLLAAIIIMSTMAVSENYAASKVKTSNAALKTTLDSIAYALGQNYYDMLKQNEIDIDFNIFFNALNDAKAGKAKFSKEKYGKISKKINY